MTGSGSAAPWSPILPSFYRLDGSPRSTPGRASRQSLRAPRRADCPQASGASLRRAGGFVPQNNSRRHPDADDIAPTLGEIEQVRVEQRADDVLRHDDKPNPCRKSAATEKE